MKTHVRITGLVLGLKNVGNAKPKHVHAMTASNGNNEWSEAVTAVTDCAKCQTRIYRSMKHQNATVQSFGSACVLCRNLGGS